MSSSESLWRSHIKINGPALVKAARDTQAALDAEQWDEAIRLLAWIQSPLTSLRSDVRHMRNLNLLPEV